MSGDGIARHYDQRGDQCVTYDHPSTQPCSRCREEASDPTIRIRATVQRVNAWTKERATHDAGAARAAAFQAEGIREALSAGVTAKELMRITGLSKARIYQIKDGTR